MEEITNEQIAEILKDFKQKIESDGMIATIDEAIERNEREMEFAKQVKNDYEAHRHDHEE